MVRTVCLLLLLLLFPVALSTPVSADWAAGAGFASFDSAPDCAVQSAMVGEVTVQRYPEYQHMYLEMVLVDPYCPSVYLQEPLIFGGWLSERGGCFDSAFLLASATLCLGAAQVVDPPLDLRHFDASLCVTQVGKTWCTQGDVILFLA